MTAQPDLRQLRDLIAELQGIVAAFDAGIVDPTTGKRWSLTAEQLMVRAKAAARAGSNGTGSGTPSYAADGSRPGSTPALALSVSEERKAWDDWLLRVQIMATYGRQAIDILAKATPAQQHPDRIEVGCRVCSRPGKPEPIYRAERCRWCYDFWLLWGTDAPESLLRLRRQGKRITENLIREHLGLVDGLVDAG